MAGTEVTGRPAVETPAGASGRRRPSLRNYWHPLCLSEEVTEQPRSFLLLNEAVVAFRDAPGVAAFKDLCIHRGTALSLGSIEDGLLTCPYHGWRYDRTGACVHIPALPPGASIPRKARAIAYRALESQGLVWVALDEPVAPLAEWPRPGGPGDYEIFLAGSWVWHSSAGRVVENGMDFSHFNFVHKGLTELADGPIIKPHEVKETSGGIEYEYFDSLITRRYHVHIPFTLHDEKVEADGKTSIITIIASPRTDTTCSVYTFISRNHADAVAMAGKGTEQGRDAVRAAIAQVFDQDRRIVESQRPEQIPTDLREEMHLKVPDANAIAYRRLLGRIEDVGPHLP